jgi:hypothetical protein
MHLLLAKLILIVHLRGEDAGRRASPLPFLLDMTAEM